MRVMLSGPVTTGPEGFDPRGAEAAFSRAEAAARAQWPRASVFNPVAQVRPGAGRPEAMRRCVSELLAFGPADVVVALDGSEASRGAALEQELARQLGVPVVPVADLLAPRAEADPCCSKCLVRPHTGRCQELGRLGRGTPAG